jgi:hypothetical protein
MWAEAMACAKAEDERSVVEAGREMLRVANGEVPLTEISGTNPTGPMSRRIVTRSPAALDSAAARLMPEVHGRLAGKAAVGEASRPIQIAVVYVDRSRRALEGDTAP